MKISRKGDYALRALICIALEYGKGMVQMHDIARKEKIPQKFLEQILLLLKNARFLQSRSGVGGGYTLNRPPEKITLGEVIRMIDGPLAPVSCVSKTAYVKCPHEERCGLRSIMLDVRNAAAEILDHIAIADICARMRGSRKRRMKKITYYV